MTLSEIHLV